MSKNIIITGPSGSGKSTAIKCFLEDKRFALSVSHTTRSIRLDEIDGVSYHFISKDEFKKNLNNFLEYAIFDNNYYGVSYKELTNYPNEYVIFDIEYQGLRNFYNKNIECIKIFVDVDYEIAKERLEKRSNNILNTNKRMETYKNFENLKNEFKFDYFINNNGNIVDLKKQINKIISKL